MGTFVGRYRPIAIGVSASYNTKDEQAALFVSSVNTATSTPAVPNVATGATAKWVGVPTVSAASTEGATATYKDDTVICMGEQYLRVTAPDVDSTADLEVIADAIDKAVFGSATVDGAMASTSTTTFLIHAAETAVGAIWKAALAAGSTVYGLIDAEIIKVTAVAGDTNEQFTCVRGALGSTAETWADDAPLYWYCGVDNTIIGVDDETVWGTIAAHTAAGGTLVVICGTEQMLVTALAPVGTDTMTVTRGYDGTTAAVHADNAPVSRYYDENSCIIDVETGHGALLADECFYKFATGGTEVFQVKTISSDRITIQRDQNRSATTMGPIADDTALFRIWGPETYDAALVAVNGTSGAPDFEEYGGPPVNTLGYNAPETAIWSTETQADAT